MLILPPRRGRFAFENDESGLGAIDFAPSFIWFHAHVNSRTLGDLDIPDGELWLVAWGGLIYSTEADASSRHFMIERHPLRTAPSLRIVRAVAVAECEDDSEYKTALVMAHSYGRCPATIDEGKLVSRLLGGTGTTM